jgi:glycosyltransferase involved in cell wall biosynthesis
MALALPVVASDIAPVRELVRPGETGLLVPPEREEPLAAALEALLADRSLAADLGRRGRERFLAELTLEHSVREMADLYRHVSAGPGRRAGGKRR